MASGRYLNKGVKALDSLHVGYVVFGGGDDRCDVPKSKIIAVGRSVIVGIDYNDVFKYRVDKNAPLPTGEPVNKLAGEQ